ncbi:ArsI/CadI family heavy metal resistance metalloenzyme [Geomicrobium sp. JCM 19055]|uniref:ArsI/CadI family heavy metal resistance metalloenzyme n=1 Tax=Geomicrobium sp. JCM 19055 TaxID=1460649 RepID=UPI00045ED29B|nr:ArsI/CadI family heavy metal resistance metalloenzyme [Geomicrobium sp. JCM 19055]GAK00714.1 lactoylglutathione lyase [Geomicrobium sp. JCM 19055]
MIRVHIGLNVSNLKESREFYEKLFGSSPSKLKGDYVKFLPKEVAINLTLSEVLSVTGNQVNHFGIQVPSKVDLLQHKERLEHVGFFAREEMDTTCCYSLQDKFWVTDPDGNEWEYFYTKQDTEIRDEDSTCCTA